MKTVLITGANRSIGYEAAKQLLEKGYFVYLGSRNADNGKQAANALKAAGFENVESITIDATNTDSINAAFTHVKANTGKLDVLVNNAGILGSFEQKATNAPQALIRQVFDTNFFGPIQITQAFLPLLEKAAQPRIVNVTSGLASLALHSDAAWKYYPVKGAAYGPSKTALNAYTVALAYELKDTPFKVNVVDPGYTATDFNHHSGPGTVHDAAAIIVKYATLDADGPTGKFFSNDYQDANGGNESPW